MTDSLAQKAIDAALSGNWEKAKKINLKILEKYPDDIGALNRLSNTCVKLGDIKNAKKYTQKVLDIDENNSIATKAMERYRGLTSVSAKKTNGATSLKVFLEEPGKTAIIKLVHLGDPQLVTKQDPGEVVNLVAHKHRVNIATCENKYLGRLPDDLAARLRQLIAKGNQYECYVKTNEPENLMVFIREVSRAKEVASIPSFPTEKLEYISFTPPELVRKKERIPSAEEEEEE